MFEIVKQCKTDNDDDFDNAFVCSFEIYLDDLLIYSENILQYQSIYFSDIDTDNLLSNHKYIYFEIHKMYHVVKYLNDILKQCDDSKQSKNDDAYNKKISANEYILKSKCLNSFFQRFDEIIDCFHKINKYVSVIEKIIISDNIFNKDDKYNDIFNLKNINKKFEIKKKVNDCVMYANIVNDICNMLNDPNKSSVYILNNIGKLFKNNYSYKCNYVIRTDNEKKYYEEKIETEKDIVNICNLLKKYKINNEEISNILLKYNCDYKFNNQ